MAGEPQITIVGNTVSEAELRFTPGGQAVANFTVAVTPRVKNGDRWEDGEAAFYRCAVWRDAAEIAAESITKGMRLVVVGRLKPRTFEKDGVKRISLDVEVDEVAASMRWARVQVSKADRSGGSGAPVDDPWGSAPPPPSGGGGFQGEPPFHHHPSMDEVQQ